MSAIHNAKSAFKLPSTLLSISLLTVTSLSTQTAQAELITNISRDEAGRTNMVVSNDKQEALPPAQLGIAPARISETVSLVEGTNKAGLNQSLTLYNYGNKPKDISLNLIDLDENGQPIAPSETTLKSWTLINPTRFTIPANGYQTIRMSFRLPIEFAPGEHKAVLMIEQQIDRSLTYDADGRGVTVELGSRYGLPIIMTVE